MKNESKDKVELLKTAERLDEIFEGLHDQYMLQKEETALLQKLVLRLSNDGLSHEICLGVRHGLFGKEAGENVSLFDFEQCCRGDDSDFDKQSD